MIEAAALVFDMDGLMVDSEPLWFEVERAFARKRGAEWTLELAHDCIGKGLVNTLDVMADRFGFVVDPEADVREMIDTFIARVAELRLKPGCRELLDEAVVKVPLALASSSHGRLVAAVVSQLGLGRYFKAITSGDLVRMPKPAPDVFLLAAERIGMAPARCVVLEDSMAGVLAARAAKMRVIAVPERNAQAFDGVADAVTADLFEARRYLHFT